MKKFISISLALTMGISLAIPAFNVSASAVNIKSTVDAKDMFPMRHWMDDMWSVIKNKHLSSEISQIIGHDSGVYESYEDAFDARQAVDASESVGTFLSGLNTVTFGAFHDIVKKGAITQTKDVYSQLSTGVRFLDLRFKRSKEDQSIRVFHGIFGPTTDEIFSQIKRFLDENPNEILSIDLNAQGGYSDVKDDEEGRKYIADKYREYLGNYTVRTSDNIYTDSTYEEVKSTGRRIILNAGNGEEVYLRDFAKNASKLGYYYVNLVDTWSGNIKNGRDFDNVLLPLNYSDYNKLKEKYDSNPSLTEGAIKYHEDINSLMAFNADEIIPTGITDLFNFATFPTLIESVEASRNSFKKMLIEMGSGAGMPEVAGFKRDDADSEEVALTLLRNLGKNAAERNAKVKEIVKSGDADAQKLVDFMRKVANTIDPSRLYAIYEPGVAYNVLASSEQAPNYKANVTDKGLNSRWAASNSSLDQWITLDLTKDNNLFNAKAVRIVWEYEDVVYKYALMASTDGVNWTTVVDNYNNNETGSILFNNLDVKTKYLKLRITGTTKGAWASVRDFSAYGSYEKPNKVLKVVNVRTDAVSETANPIQNTLDFNPLTRWCAVDDKLHEYVLELEKPQYVAYVSNELEFEQNKYRYNLQGSLDGVNWFDVNTQRTSTNDSDTRDQRDAFGATVKFVKVKFTELKEGKWVTKLLQQI